MVGGRLRVKLEEQIDFLESSSERFDQGRESEAIRLAQQLRILFHQTHHSKALVYQANLASQKMLTSRRNDKGVYGFLAIKIALDSERPIWSAPLLEKNAKYLRGINLGEWWQSEKIFSMDEKSYTRKSIILSMANKDGGAHVDPVLEDYYLRLCEGEQGLKLTGDLQFNGSPPFPQGVSQSVNNMHFALVRQFAYEALSTVNRNKWL